ncbi:MAG: CoA-binding protein [Calditrichia bacterium]
MDLKAVNQNIPEILQRDRKIAVVGISNKPHRASYQVAEVMIRAGYEVYPVNPVLEEVLGRKCYASLSEIPEDIDLVDIFRRPEFVEDIVDAAIAKGVNAVWMQLGVVNEAAAEKALKAGLDVVMDRCWKIEYMQNREL